MYAINLVLIRAFQNGIIGLCGMHGSWDIDPTLDFYCFTEYKV